MAQANGTANSYFAGAHRAYATRHNTIPTVAALPQEQQSAARVSIRAPGPMLLLPPCYGASGQPYRGLGGLLAFDARHAFQPRWAALGCDATSRHQSNAKGAEVCKPPRLSFRVIQTRFDQAVRLVAVSLRVGLVIVLKNPIQKRQSSNEISVGGFHVVLNPSVPVIQQ